MENFQNIEVLRLHCGNYISKWNINQIQLQLHESKGLECAFILHALKHNFIKFKLNQFQVFGQLFFSNFDYQPYDLAFER